MTDMKTSEILIKAKALINNPDKWMQGDYTDGNNCFCSLGAIAEVTGAYPCDVSNLKAAITLREVVADSDRFQASAENFAAYNDRSNHEEVMQAFDKAINLCVNRGD